MSGRLSALIVDDEPAARAALRSLLSGDPEVEVAGECGDGRAAIEAIETIAPDILFLDVQMPEVDGFSVLRQMDAARPPVVIFVTAYDQYALQAFDVHAVDYLLKPFDDGRFRQALGRAKQLARQGKLGSLSQQLKALLDGVGGGTAAGPGGQYLRRLTIKSGGRVTIVPTRDIDWIEAEGDYVKIHAGKTWHLLRETMKHLETEFDPATFVRIHRSTIVNVERIKELQPYFRGEYVVILQDGTKLKLSRGYKEQLETALGRSF
jgi:two-component system LytT family response regulator